jgi:hypothetical protein
MNRQLVPFPILSSPGGNGNEAAGSGPRPNRHQWGFSKCSTDSTLKARNLREEKTRLAQGKKRLLTRRLSWLEVAVVFRTSWDSVYRAVEYAVSWGLTHRQLEGIRAIGVDEVQWQRGHK